jgi:hypothetical protein
MSWATYKNTIETVLTDNNYREVPENKTIEVSALSHNNAVYRLQPVGTSEIVETTSNGMQYNYKVILELKYKNIDSNERHVNFDSFLNVFEAIAMLSEYKGTLSEPTFEDIDEKHTKGMFAFLFGERINC